MKKFEKRSLGIFLMAFMFVFAVSTATAQVPQGQQENPQEQQPQDQQVTPQENQQSSEMGDDKDYSEEIQESEIPEPITTSLDSLYPAHEIAEAHRADDGFIKVKMKNADDEAAVYFDSNGEFIKAKDLSNESGSSQTQGMRMNQE